MAFPRLLNFSQQKHQGKCHSYIRLASSFGSSYVTVFLTIESESSDSQGLQVALKLLPELALLILLTGSPKLVRRSQS